LDVLVDKKCSNDCNCSASSQDYTERLRLLMLSSVQGEKCEFMPNRMFKCRVAQGCAGTVKGK